MKLPPMTGQRPFLTRHALERCREMGVTRAEVVETLAGFDCRYPSPSHYGPDRYVSAHRRLAVVHTPDLVVITVLWNGLSGREPSGPDVPPPCAA